MKALSSAFVSALASVALAGPPAYRVVFLGADQNMIESYSHEVNDAGEVAGTWGPGTKGVAFRWTEGGGLRNVKSLAPFPLNPYRAEAWGINATGQVCGHFDKVGPDHEIKRRVFRYTPGRRIETYDPVNDCKWAEAYCINGQGWIGGGCYFGEGGATVWKPGQQGRTIGTLGTGGTPMRVAGLNDSGEGAGVGYDGVAIVAFRWSETEGVVGLPTLPFYDNGQADDIGDDGTVVGQSWGFLFGYRGTLWKKDGTVLQIGSTPGLLMNVLFGANGKGEAVGEAYYDDRPDQKGLYWSAESGIVYFDDLLEPGSAQWHVIRAEDISDDGKVACSVTGSDGQPKAALLVPLR